MNELLVVLLSWAVTLSGYPIPAEPPNLVMVPHEFFVQNACGGHECRVYGWYSKGKNIYIDDRMNPSENTIHASIVIHEMVHYLQGVAHNDETQPCEKVVEMEREAYGVQREFIHKQGIYFPVGMSMARVSCI